VVGGCPYESRFHIGMGDCTEEQEAVLLKFHFYFFTLISVSALLQERVLVAPADTAARVEEPVHEDSSAVVVWIVSKQTVPLVLLFTSTVPTAPACCGFRANFLVDRLFKLLVVHYCSHLSIAITCPVGRHNFHF